jgi:co-chaperonin GroES (HSP10)
MSNLFDPKELNLLGDRILVEIAQVSEKMGVIYLPPEKRRQERNKAICGKLIAFTDKSFKDEDEKPEIGDTLYFHQYAGRVMITEDLKEMYRNLSPKDLIGFVKKK